MRRSLTLLVAVCALLFMSPPIIAAQSNYRTLFIEPASDGFEMYIAAAIVKKKTPITVITDRAKADYLMRASPVEAKSVGGGTKLVNCLFAYCAGNSDKGNTSVQLTDRDGIVRWSYAVNKGRGEKNKQSLAEAIAKHMKDDFLNKR